MYALQDLERGVKRAQVASWFAIGALGLTVVYAVAEASFSLTFESSSTETIDAMIAVEDAYPALLLATAAAFITWSFLAHANLALFQRDGIAHQNQATIWWWMVPIAQIWMPFRVIFETGRGSFAAKSATDWRTSRVPSVAVWWTALFIAGLLATNVSAALIEGALTANDLRTALNVHALAFVIYGAAAVVGILMIDQFMNAQRRLERGIVVGFRSVTGTGDLAIASTSMLSDEAVVTGLAQNGAAAVDVASVVSNHADESVVATDDPPHRRPPNPPSTVTQSRKRLWIKRIALGAGSVLIVLACLVGWQAWSWNQLLANTAYVDDAAMWEPYFEVIDCGLQSTVELGEPLDSWASYEGQPANREIDARLRGRVDYLNETLLMPWQKATNSALARLNTHYVAWFAYLDVENGLMTAVIDGTISDPSEFYAASAAGRSEIGPTFWAAKDAYYAAAPFWVSDDEIEAAFLDSEDIEISCREPNSAAEGTDA